uniref:Platelet-derived growth factor receptor-like protein n=1 Tax=Anopheles stephensi TaxID=30069 RepID=A0A182Y9A4_ANOST
MNDKLLLSPAAFGRLRSPVLTECFLPTGFTALDDLRIVREQDGNNAHGAPEIDTVTEEITLPKGASWNFTCKSHHPIMWKHYAASYDWEPMNVFPHDFETDDPDKPYGSVLMLTDASADQVGRYYCVDRKLYDEKHGTRNGEDGEEEEEDPTRTAEDEMLDEMVAEYAASAVYVYVDDPDNPLVPVHTPVFRVEQYQDFVIPCKPTHPKIAVELYKDLEGDLVEEYQYSNTQGYLLSFNRLEDGGSYYCQVQDKPHHRIHFEIAIDEHCEFPTTDIRMLRRTFREPRERSQGLPTSNALYLADGDDDDASNGTVAGTSVTYANATEDRPTTPRPSTHAHGANSSHVPLTSTSEPLTEYLTKPSIHSDTKDHVLLGQRIRLVCKLNIRAGVPLDMTWMVPPNLKPAVADARMKIGPLKLKPVKEAEHREIATRELIIEQATLADDGTYRCVVQDIKNHRNYHSFKLQVRDSQQDYVLLSEENNLSEINVRRNANGKTPSIDIVIEYRSFPATISYYWLMDDDEITAGQDGKYELSHSDTHVKLRINDPKVFDTGNYTVFVMAGNAEKSYRMAVHVYAKPILHMESKFVKPGEEVSFQCRSIGYPRPDISFAFLPCLGNPWTNCSIPSSKETNWDLPGGKRETQITKSRIYTLIPKQPGVVYCKAINTEGSEVTQADLLISDLTDSITLEKEQPKETITVGDHVTIACSALVYNHTRNIALVLNDKELQEADGARLSYSDKLYAWQAHLDIKHITHEHEGTLYCRVKTMLDTVETRAFRLEVLDPIAPMLGLKYVNLSFSTNNVNHHPLQHPTAFYHNHIDSGSTQYVDPKKHLNSKGYVRHSGLQNMGMVDSCNTEHYLELNEPYLQMNAEKVERGDTDYLANLGPPEEPAPAAPNYVNGIILPLPPKIRSDKDYLKMSRAKSESEESNFDFASFNSDRHSPTTRNNLDTSPPNGSKRHKKRGLPEEIPMLDGSRLSYPTNGFNSDSETEAVSPKPRERTSKHNPEPEYMNVKNAKLAGRSSNDELGSAGVAQEAISNPGYIALSMVDEKRC